MPFLFSSDTAFLQFFQYIHPMQLEHQERIVVYLQSYHIHHGCNMLARHSPVGTTAIHIQVSPRIWEHFQLGFLGYIEHGRRKIHIEQLWHDGRICQYTIHQPLRLLLRKLIHLHGDTIRSPPTSLHLCLNLIIIKLHTLHRAIACISSTTRYAIGIIYMREGLQPSIAPPRLAKTTCHKMLVIFNKIYYTYFSLNQ